MGLDLNEIREQLNDYQYYNKRYILLKAKMIRQGVLESDFNELAKKKETQLAMANTAVTFPNPQDNRPVTSQTGARGAFNSTKGFGEVGGFGDPSIKKLKEDIAQKERQNQELEDEITRLRYSLQDHVGDNELVATLHREIEIKQDLIKDRDDDIK